MAGDSVLRHSGLRSQRANVKPSLRRLLDGKLYFCCPFTVSNLTKNSHVETGRTEKHRFGIIILGLQPVELFANRPGNRCTF